VNKTAVLVPPPPEEVHKTLAARTSEVEDLVRRAYSKTLRPQFPSGIALAAVGGFGRGELFPHADADLLLVVELENQILSVREALPSFLVALRDSGPRPNLSVRSLSECVTDQETHAELTISLLDSRLLEGDPLIFQRLDERFRALVAKRGATIAKQLAGLCGERHAKCQNTIYHLEPNIKDTPGGLRDLQTVRWLATLEQREPARDLSTAFDFLAALRIRLHDLAGRDQNVLDFDMQEALSEHPAALMRDYYHHARLVDRTLRTALEAAVERAGGLIGRFHEWRSRLSTSEFTVSRDRVFLRAPRQMPQRLSMFEFVARHRLRLAPDTIERLAGFVPQTRWDDWKRLLSLPRPSFGLRAMQEAGTLAAALPEWRNIECLVVPDFYHRYTVDEHTLVAIDSLESIGDPRLAGLLEETADLALVRFALLLHDIGKGSGVEHSQESVRIGRLVMERLGTPEPERNTIEFLVRHHLDLSSVMTSRDLGDGSTARTLAADLGTIERLKQLTIITYADISAVNPQAMTPWRLEQLWRVYLLAYEELTKELHTERIHHAAGVSPERAAFLEGLPTRYARTHTQAEIDAHFELARLLQSQPVAIEIGHERSLYRLTLLTRDRPALFASVAGAISSFGLNIVSAEAFSNAQGIVVDTFTFTDPNRTLELNPPAADRLRASVRRVAEGTEDPGALVASRPKVFLSSRAARVEPRVAFNNEASEAATLIEIVAADRPGLLHDLARTITAAGCNIEVVMINTEAHKALDVFYVTAGGGKLGAGLEAQLKGELLAACR
jgi:[protein-PII] uridylyltransferase